MEFINKFFKNENVLLDFNEYNNCTFENCDMMFGGNGNIVLNGCHFDSVRWRFVGNAANTLDFMQAMYHGGDAAGRKLIEETFENIRAGRVREA